MCQYTQTSDDKCVLCIIKIINYCSREYNFTGRCIHLIKPVQQAKHDCYLRNIHNC